MQAPYDTLNDRVTAVTGEDANELIERIRQLGISFGKQKAYVEGMEHGRKVVLADLHEKHREVCRRNGEKASEKQLENESRRDKEYRDYLKLMLDHRYKLAEIEAEYYALRNRLDMLTEQLRFARSEMQSL